MKITKYNCTLTVEEAIEKDDPLFAGISFDDPEAIMCHADEAVEHYALLQKVGTSGANN